MMILMPPLWPAIPLILAAAGVILPFTTYSAVGGGFGGTMTGLVTAAALVAAAF